MKRGANVQLTQESVESDEEKVGDTSGFKRASEEAISKRM
jgi:hypothetical protein